MQVSRLGNPLVNEVVIPVGKKDQFNRTTPDRDAELYGQFVVKPELAAILNLLFNVGAPETNRLDIVQAVLQGLPGLNQQSKNPKPVDTIKLNLGIAPAANPNPLGALAGDLAGYPNGRRLTDDVVDIELQVVAGELADPKVLGADACKAPAKCPNPTDLGDGVPENDKPFLSTFPYLVADRLGLRLAGSRRTTRRPRTGSRMGASPLGAPTPDSIKTFKRLNAHHELHSHTDRT